MPPYSAELLYYVDEIPTRVERHDSLLMERVQGYLPLHFQEQLIYWSTSGADADIGRFTSDAIRFANVAAVEKWLAKRRMTYLLTDLKSATLYGIVWFGAEKMPMNFPYTTPIEREEYPFTFAYRMYGEARGKGLGRRQFATALGDFLRTQEYLQFDGGGLWEWTSVDNVRVLAVERKMGFKIVSDPNENNKIISVVSAHTLQQTLGLVAFSRN